MAEIAHVHAGEVEHERRNPRADECRAQVRLFQYERDKDEAGQSGGQDRSPEVLNRLHAILQEPRQKEHQRGLGNLRRLKGERAKSDPAVRGMRVVHQERNQQQEDGDSYGGKDHIGLVVAPVVDLHEQDHCGESEDRPQRLPDNKGVGGAEALLGHDGRGAEDHKKSDDDQHQGCAKEPLVYAYAFCHSAPMRSAIQVVLDGQRPGP